MMVWGLFGIIQPNVGLLLIAPVERYINQISIRVQLISSKKINLNMASAKCRLFCLELKKCVKRLETVNLNQLYQFDMV